MGRLIPFPEDPRHKATRQSHDVDYGGRSYYVETRLGREGIAHGSGPSWSYGMPNDGDVWRSIKYEEITYDARPFTIIDARGQMKDGKRWRFLGKPGESASYSYMDAATAKIFDKFLDGAFLSAPAHNSVP